jgi:acyl-CoA thioester hydrolase
MGILHHANYIKIFEETRVHWLRDLDLLGHHQPAGELAFAVVSLSTKFLAPVHFDAVVHCKATLELDGLRLKFEYELFSAEEPSSREAGSSSSLKLCSRAVIELMPVGRNLRPTRIPKLMHAKLQSIAKI